MNKPNIYHELPLSCMQHSRAINDGDYCLIHLTRENEEYKNFFKKVIAQKEYRPVIIDNSVFELGEAFSIDEFVDSILDLLPSEPLNHNLNRSNITYVIPDVLYDCKSTITKAKEWESRFPIEKKYEGPLTGMKRMAVVQGSTIEEMLECAGALIPLVDTLGVSFNCKAYTEMFDRFYPDTDTGLPLVLKWSTGRLVFLILLKYYYYSDPFKDRPDIHLLGCGTPQEMYYIFKMTAFLEQLKDLDKLNIVGPSLKNILFHNLAFPFWVDMVKRLVGIITEQHLTMETTFDQLSFISNYIKSVDTSNPIIQGYVGERYHIDFGCIGEDEFSYDDEYRGPGLFEKNHKKLADIMFDDVTLTEDMIFNINEFRSYCNRDSLKTSINNKISGVGK